MTHTSAFLIRELRSKGITLLEGQETMILSENYSLVSFTGMPDSITCKFHDKTIWSTVQDWSDKGVQDSLEFINEEKRKQKNVVVKRKLREG
jgi:hypothetical protein